MKILIDMNLSPLWTAAFRAADIEAVHWSTIGRANAEDTEIVEYARANNMLFSLMTSISEPYWH